MDYPFREIETAWQKFWEENQTFKTDSEPGKKKFYCLDMFPYPSGAGLHVGHPEGYTATDIISRFKRMTGHSVLHPMGWDAFGLPAERYAMKTGIHPAITTKENITTFKRQIQMLGLSYDWNREISTTDPTYYKFTQWIFLKMYNTFYHKGLKKGLPITDLVKGFEKEGSKYLKNADPDASHKFSKEEWKNFSQIEKESVLKNYRLVYMADIPVNWCEGLGSVLANEEVNEWVEKGYTVIKKPMRQYMMRITAYADRLLEDLSLVSWPQSTLEMQKNWIGKSRGLELSFLIHKDSSSITVFTTRPDTIFGATYLVLAPEHPIVGTITTESQKIEMNAYIQSSIQKSDLDRTELNKTKTGVFTGAYALNPASGKKIPIWVSDYVLYGYGTGAIMAVPAHDQRDLEFAKKFKLDVIQVIEGPEIVDTAFDSKESKCVQSTGKNLQLDGLSHEEAFTACINWAVKKKIGKEKIQFKLRDWLFARQRYWGEPIPLIHYDTGLTVPVHEDFLPLELPEVKEFKPTGTGESPLATALDWVTITDREKGSGKRETNTMPQWAGSCWYYLRFIDPNNSGVFCDPNLEKKWMPVDLYVGGAEHAVLHLLYSRFWHKVLYDLGEVSTPEPFKKLVHQGLILGEDKRKMSKSLGNVINPDEVVKQFGADSLRLFEMFMGPFEAVKPWSTHGVEGIFRFLNRVWRLYHGQEGNQLILDEQEPTPQELRILHKTIKKVGEDIENFSFNTAISQMMIFTNELTPSNRRPKKILLPFLLLLAPFAPHIAEELWKRAGNQNTLSYEPFPVFNPDYISEDEITIVVQVNGKLRDEFKAPLDISEADAIAKSLDCEKAKPFFLGKEIIKKIYVKGKLVNIVVKE